MVLLQTHYNQLVTTPAARPLLTVLKEILYSRIKVISDSGFFFLPYFIRLVEFILYCLAIVKPFHALFFSSSCYLFEINLCFLVNITSVKFVQECKDTLGFNLAAMDHLKVHI